MDDGTIAEESDMKTMRCKIQDTGYRIKKTDTGHCLQVAVKNERGMVLIVSLLLLLVATVVGITALSTSTTNVIIAGNQRLKEINFTGADSGAYVCSAVIDSTAFYSSVDSNYSSLVQDSSDFLDEINGGDGGDCPVLSPTCTNPAPDIQFTMGSGSSAITVSVDVDYLYAAFSAGSAVEFASGYEGIGKSASGGGASIYYAISSVGQGSVGSENSVYAVYRYVTK